MKKNEETEKEEKAIFIITPQERTSGSERCLGHSVLAHRIAEVLFSTLDITARTATKPLNFFAMRNKTLIKGKTLLEHQVLAQQTGAPEG